MMAIMNHCLKLGIIFLACIASLSISSPHGLQHRNTGLDYYFYESQSGVDPEGLHALRLRRDVSDNEAETSKSAITIPTSTPTTSRASVGKTTDQVPTTIREEDVSDVKSRKEDEIMSNPRGWQPPDNATAILKEIDLPDAKINATLKSHLDHLDEEGLKLEDEDHYKYYNSTFTAFNSSWIDLDVWNRTTHPGIVQQHSMLSKSYRRAATISLKFKFPFYGHFVENITIATGGFLYTGEYVHSWLAATQYIAPLMANFDTSQEESATVKYADNGTTLVVEWGNVYLQGREGSQHMEGPFTFQAILHKNGDIIFAYKTIPVSIMTITDDEHPVKVGLSDAYIIERTIFFVRRKTIYEYHRVNMKGKEIANQTAIYLKALPRCNMKKNCQECLALTVEENEGPVACMWCPKAKLCSDGFDRNKQQWLKFNCDKASNRLLGGDPDTTCRLEDSMTGHPEYDSTYSVDDNSKHQTHDHDYSDPTVDEDDLGQNEEQDHLKDNQASAHHAGVATLTIVILLVITICGWFLYAYFFPHTCSGQLLIKYRPSRWHWRRGEARYTAASIHM